MIVLGIVEFYDIRSRYGKLLQGRTFHISKQEILDVTGLGSFSERDLKVNRRNEIWPFMKDLIRGDEILFTGSPDDRRIKSHRDYELPEKGSYTALMSGIRTRRW